MRRKKPSQSNILVVVLVLAIIPVSIVAGFFMSGSAETAVNHAIDVQAEMNREPSSVMDMIEDGQRIGIQGSNNEDGGLVWVIVAIVLLGGASLLMYTITLVTKNAIAFIRALKKKQVSPNRGVGFIDYVQPVQQLQSKGDSRFLTDGLAQEEPSGGDTSWLE